MTWFGKILGGYLGFALGGPVGIIVGAALGHQFDHSVEDLKRAALLNATHRPAGAGPQPRRPSTAANLEQEQLVFFVCVFSMLAKLAKADGAISKDEIAMVERFMKQDLQLDTERSKFAIDIFREAKSSTNGFEEFAQQFYDVFRGRNVILENLLDTLLRLAAVDGSIAPAEEAMLRNATRIFRISDAQYKRIASRHQQGAGDPYAVLGLTKAAGEAEVKKAYRRLALLHHPDRVHAKGLPEEFTKVASEKFRAIQEAYDSIRKDRGFA